ncbi:cytochrome b5 reductase 4 isoform X2 [Eurytemora carolleeae]|uniref:cytochrome b5 reductase 4 isoform X2 n=1 Tax=Eurytemora carolleeae TaxID=1294199 RepID=UPI000C76D616|nr:cytochrome b5 reductase 4 isoform X2 [Eurytemora carolleeae]|eukprot:XP_023330321.1 cytochrome b5 reductase 4-like isoform X2 [Eurytemora affinis]
MSRPGSPSPTPSVGLMLPPLSSPPGRGGLMPPRLPSNLIVPTAGSLSVPNPGGLFPLPNSQQLASGSATGIPRNKVALQKGFSIMDWVRLTKSGKDLTGVGGPRVNGKIREVTREELAKHKTRKDSWMALNGAVYNVTAYMNFHPGGWDELVKGAGIDATDLFNEVHRWVNYDSMLSSCLVGKLVEGPAPHLAPPVPPILLDEDQTDNPSPISVIPPIAVRPVPTYDFFQTDNKLTINIYTRRKGLTKENFIVDNFLHSVRIVCLFPDKTGFMFHHELSDRVLGSIAVRVGSGGKLELDLVKQTPSRWQNLGKPLELDSWFGNIQDMKLTYRKYTVTRVENCTHDTKHVVLEPVYSTHLVVPPGKHIHIRGEREELELVRSYTPVIPLNSGTDSEDSELHFLIKIYMDGAFTPLIDDLKIGDELELSDYTGDFNINKLKEFSQIYLIAAGTGITPIARILPLLSGVKTTLIYFNKTIKEIIRISLCGYL